ncbi:hypothetical protein [Spirosoma koreense]
MSAVICLPQVTTKRRTQANGSRLPLLHPLLVGRLRRVQSVPRRGAGSKRPEFIPAPVGKIEGSKSVR